jgi:hypothetical protein
MARLSSAFSSCCRSTCTGIGPPSRCTTTSMSSPVTRRRKRPVCWMNRSRSIHWGSSGCRRANASRRRVRLAPSRAAEAASSRSSPISASAVSPSFSSRTWRLVRMMVSRLLKSCAMDPVSWPTTSIFCDCTQLGVPRLALRDVGEGDDGAHDDPVPQHRVGAVSSAGKLVPSARQSASSSRRTGVVLAAGPKNRGSPRGVGAAVAAAVVDQRVNVAPEQLLLVPVTEHPQGGPIDEGALAAGVHAEDAFTGRCQDQGQLILAPAQVQVWP